MMEVTTGKKERYLAGELFSLKIDAICEGRGTYTVYLNGGSDTRRATREYWQQFAASLGVPCRVMGGCVVVIGHG